MPEVYRGRLQSTRTANLPSKKTWVKGDYADISPNFDLYVCGLRARSYPGFSKGGRQRQTGGVNLSFGQLFLETAWELRKWDRGARVKYFPM